MKLRSITSIVSTFLILGLVGCDGVSSVSGSNEAAVSEQTVLDGIDGFNANIIALEAMTYIRGDAAKSNPRPTIWADGELFGSVVTPNQFKPTAGNFDQLYMGGNGFLNGVPLISEAKPGDQDYNGGRWHVNVLKAGVDPDKYADADHVDDLNMDDFDAMPDYFECPLNPVRGGQQ